MRSGDSAKNAGEADTDHGVVAADLDRHYVFVARLADRGVEKLYILGKYQSC